MVSFPTPVPNEFFHPRLCSSIGAPAGSGPTNSPGSAAPCAFPNVCPPAVKATVSSSFMAILANVSRISLAEAKGSGFPSGPSGFT